MEVALRVVFVAGTASSRRSMIYDLIRRAESRQIVTFVPPMHAGRFSPGLIQRGLSRPIEVLLVELDGNEEGMNPEGSFSCIFADAMTSQSAGLADLFKEEGR